MRIVVLDAATLGEVDFSLLKRFGDVDVYPTTNEDEKLQRIKDADIIVTNKVVIDKEAMDHADNLKLICIAATGMNNVDLEYAKKKNIAVKNVVGYSTESVVQHTFAMAFYLIEHMRYYDEYVKSGQWSNSGLFTCIDRPFFEIFGKRWGIIGLGAIGKRVAEVAKSFGCDVVYHSTSGKNLDQPYKHLDLNTLLCTSDIISIHAPLNEHTKGLIKKEQLQKLQDKAVLLNLGRGGIIDEADLAYIIDQKEIYVGLDVTQKEPLPKDSPLLKVKNKDRLLITPHIAWTSIEARERLFASIIENIENFLRS
ncbi:MULTISPECIES: D-2-hydroxyacid dehydrogenase [unclassified Nitratiruptor]|uniref:D-2-hydroxyacid dehydrogenase n=1 Tax=unclassified Nitratiruptor TaxID=2624044 RepID=UPI001915C4C8|nr:MULTISPECIES: D-2-hydroxyacid dehydrogenase [unclassified Nitratiruptor]BCD59395.1 glycerate dehydrogenase [Nitratiruptor sp. YY08-10]BCD63319.1 glycerate dehydrogenase [Nitratiruptor sp. YY08-14]